jgi:hypothetical protein
MINTFSIKNGELIEKTDKTEELRYYIKSQQITKNLIGSILKS